jgi:hypothetical protein
MAWVTVRADGTAAAVAFMQDQLTVESGMNLLEIDDAVVIAVMEGQRSLNSLFDPAPLSQIAEPQEPLQIVSRWTKRYPAIMSETDIDALRDIAAMISADAIAVEVGSRLGGSAKCIMDHAPSIKRLYCIDPSWREPVNLGIKDPWTDGMRDFWHLYRYESCQQFAEGLLHEYPQVRLLPFSSPDDLGWWQEPVDFMFEDSSHANPQLKRTLDFWVPLVKNGGIIAGHDYARNWPDVRQEADALAARLGAELTVRGTIWWIRKP